MALSERDGEGAAPIDRGAASKETRQVAATRMEVKMIIHGLSTGYYDTKYTSVKNKADVMGVSFAGSVNKAAESSSTGRTESYKDYLKQKYGNVRYESVGKDQESLDRAGKGMSGNDVIIAPNIVEEMANDPEKAAYYEGKIDDFFNDIPRAKAMFAAQGLNYEPCGVVIHEDGSVTYISGCNNDTPETRARIKAEQAEKRARREKYHKLSEEAAERRREEVNEYVVEK